MKNKSLLNMELLKISRIFASECIPIVFAIDDRFSFGLSVMIESIIENAKKEMCYDLIILHRNVSLEHQKVIIGMQDAHKNICIRFFNVEKYSLRYAIFNTHVTKELYYRLLIPELLSEYEKVIYADGDMIALTDIAELFQIDMKDYLFAAVKDICGNWHYYEENSILKSYLDIEIELKGAENYINAGLLIMNLKEIRKKYSTEELWNLVDSRKWLHHDQDIINKMGEEKIYILPYEWNLVREYPALALQYMPKDEQNKWKQAFKEPKIIHFAGRNKPWKGLKVPGYPLFWKYALESPLVEEAVNTFDAQICYKRTMEQIKLGDYRVGYIIRELICWLKTFIKKKE